MSRQRYEREIEDILERAGEAPDEQPGKTSGRAPQRRRGSPSPQRGQSVRHFGLKYQYALIAGIVLILVGAVAQWLYFFFAGLALVVAGYIIYYRAPKGSSRTQRTQQMWRGRPIDPDEPTDSRRR